MEKNDPRNISVIIPTYNSWVTLKDCIASIQKQTLRPYEVIVVDNASSDGTSDKVKKKFPNVRLITLKKNTGVTGGRNMGIKLANPSSDYLFFFDHDMVAEKDMLKELLKVAETNPRIGIVTPKIYYFGNKKRIWSAGTGINLWTGQVLFRGGDDVGQYEKVEEVQVAPAAILVKKELIKKIKSFDDTYFATYEDTDFCFRARKEGFKTFYASKALAYHKISWDPKDDADRVLSRAYWVGRNRIIFMKKFSKNFAVFTLFIPLFIGYYLLLSISTNRFKDGFNFLLGTFAGLFTFSIPERNIPFSFIWIIRNTIDDRVETILDLACGEGKLTEAISAGKNWEVTGVDIDSVSLDKAFLVKVYKRLICGDVETIAKRLIKTGKKFDVVICLEILEHLTKEKGNRLLDLIEKLALKQIIVTTPRGYMEQIDESLGHNSYQQHISGWYENEFIARGYIVRGLGLKPVWSYDGFGRSKLRFVRVVARIVSYLLFPLAYYFPFLGASLLAMKPVKK